MAFLFSTEIGGWGMGAVKKTPCSSWMHCLRSINQPLAPWMTINQPLSPPSSSPLPFPTPNPQSAGIGVINLKHTYVHLVCYRMLSYGIIWYVMSGMVGCDQSPAHPVSIWKGERSPGWLWWTLSCLQKISNHRVLALNVNWSLSLITVDHLRNGSVMTCD